MPFPPARPQLLELAVAILPPPPSYAWYRRRKSLVMRSFLLTWHPGRWFWTDLADALEAIAVSGVHRMFWSVGTRTDVPLESRLFMMRLGEDPKGLVGSGWSVGTPTMRPHWDPERAAAGDHLPMVDAEFDVLSEYPLVPLAALEKLSDTFSWTPRSSGVEIPGELAARLESLVATSNTPQLGEGMSRAGTFIEGSLQRSMVNRYERNREARARCIEFYDAVCFACKFSFAKAYGDEFDGYIHVHHIVPIADRGEAYRLDPVRDLRPLCPNCHAAVHYLGLSMEELRKRLARTHSG